jgi:glycosyltransferase involved in cell wall biosynthesis
MRIGILASHPIQYQTPWFRALAEKTDLEVFFAHRPDAQEQSIGFGRAFQWDVDLLSGYSHTFLHNESRPAGTQKFFGCDTPTIRQIIEAQNFYAFIVSGWNLKSYWQAIRACRRRSVPVLVRGDSQLMTGRSLMKRCAKIVVYRRILRQFDGFLFVGKRNLEYLQHYGAPNDRLFFVPHFVDNERFRAEAGKALAYRDQQREVWGVTPHTTVALFVGKMMENKRPHDLLRALARLRASPTKVAAVFVGSGELEPSLWAEAHNLQVAAHFEGFRNQSELAHYYVASDVLVLPSDAETWGLVVNEAMACGIPAIVSDAVGCVPDLIENGRTGYTFRVGDVDALADTLVMLANSSRSGFNFRPHLRQKLETFSIETATRGTIEAVQSLCARTANLGTT